MTLQSWSSNPQMNRPDRLNVLEKNWSTSCEMLNSADDSERFYTPRATFKRRVDKIQIPRIVVESESKFPSKKVSDSTKRRLKQFRRFDTQSPYKHRDVRDLLKSAKRRLGRLATNLQDSQASQGSVSAADARVQFALSQTPPIGGEPSITHTSHHGNRNSSLTHQTLSPVIQCFQKGMPRSHDPTRVGLLREEERIMLEKRVSISVEDIRGAIGANGKWGSKTEGPIAPYPLPQFFLQPPSSAGGGGKNGGSAVGSMNSLRASYNGKKQDDELDLGHRGELDISEKYNYDLSKAQLKASSRTSALLAGFAMVCLVELQYDQSTSKPLLIVLGVVTSLLVSVHLLALMMSTCILPYMEATGCTQDSPHLKLKFYIDLSWLFSTCIGLLLFLVEIGVIFYVKFTAVGYPTAGYITTAMLVPVGIVFVVFSYLIHKSRVSHSLGRFKDKVDTMKQFLDVEANLQKSSMAASTVRDI